MTAKESRKQKVNKLISALAVVVLDKNIRTFLKANDPKCLEQCLKALRECDEVKATNIVANYKQLVSKDNHPEVL